MSWPNHLADLLRVCLKYASIPFSMGILPLINTENENLACALQAPLKCGHLRHVGRASSWHTTCCPGVVYNETEILAKNTWAISTKVLIMKRISPSLLSHEYNISQRNFSFYVYILSRKKKFSQKNQKNSIKGKKIGPLILEFEW